MKTLLVAVVIFCLCGIGLSAENVPRTHKFQIWGTLNTDVEKIDFLMGFTNGLLASGVTVLECNGNQQAHKPKLDCILFSKDLQLEQAVAMIDKYYKENPEKWSEPVGFAIIDALTVNGGPCAGTDSKK